MTKSERKRVVVLQRRIDHLTIALTNWQGKSMDRARAERKALAWALEIIDDYFSSE